MKRASMIAAIACSLFGAAELEAAPGHSYGFGSRATALGGAVTAGGGGADSLFYNPAALALAPSSELLLGYRGVDTSLYTNHKDANIPGFSTVDGAALARGSFWGIPVGFGLGLALTNGHLSRVSTVREDEPYWFMHETLPELFDMSAALSVRPLRWLSIGVGSGFLATTQGGFMVQGTAQLSDGRGSEYDSQLRHSVNAELISVRYLLVGVVLELPRSAFPHPKNVDWRVGVSLRDEAKLEQQLQGTLEGTVDGGAFQIPVRYDFQSQGLVAFQPRQLVLGASAQSGPWHAGLDVAWEQWSRYPSPIARSGTEVTADIPAGLPLALPPNQELPPSELAGFDDRITFRVGIERSLTFSPRASLALRAGYAYLPSPPVRTDIVGQLLDADQHVLSLGSGLRLQKLSRYLPQRVSLDVHGLWVRLPNKRQTRDRTTFLAKGHALSAGLTLTAAFAP